MTSLSSLIVPGAHPMPCLDHHHWKHETPVNFAARDGCYSQILCYPNGFSVGDRNLKIIPGRHLGGPSSTLLSATPPPPMR
jgi:hypothetical protein